MSVSALEFEMPTDRLREVAEHVTHAAREISTRLRYGGGRALA